MNTEARFDPREFRATLGTFTTGVTIITARGADGLPVGVTANSFNSVSLDPPMVLWSLARNARSLEAFQQSGHFAVHILSAGQEDLSNRFAKSGADKFTGVACSEGAGGAPLLDDCSARLQCRTSFVYEGGDHLIFVGEVVAFDRSGLPPLVFQAGRYAVATRKAASLSSGSLDAGWSEDHLPYLLGRAYFQVYFRIREHVRADGLSDDEYFILSTLAVRDGRTQAEIEAGLSHAGCDCGFQVLAGLRQRGLLRCEDGTGDLRWFLSDEGRRRTLHLIAAAKAIESEVLAGLGEWDAVALKNLLKQLVLSTDPGLPDLWSPPPAATTGAEA
ncbi:flavin reductase [Solimonas sp. K1W22B-7]|uniref:flavin reductase n=1 Tax=Solimonas sp. K1W22B-7 TaxID=2303331 RepID=UPI000E335EB9|nr:flavin reductase [Solimonas sp. K1W22B-7]AXQ28731.1 flavin reductase [Solimonas sp. K1W22B-7]